MHRIEVYKIQREAILRFWALMNNLDYEEVLDEYRGYNTNDNRLFSAVEATISYMNQPDYEGNPTRLIEELIGSIRTTQDLTETQQRIFNEHFGELIDPTHTEGGNNE